MFRKTHLFGIHALPPVLGSMQQYIVGEYGFSFGESFISVDGEYFAKQDVVGSKQVFGRKEGVVVNMTSEIDLNKMASIFIGISFFKALFIKLMVKWDMNRKISYDLMKSSCVHWSLGKLKLVDKELESRLNHFVCKWDDSAYNDKVLNYFGEAKKKVFKRGFSPFRGRVHDTVAELAKNITANA